MDFQRKADQAWEMAGLARQDGDKADEARWTAKAKAYQSGNIPIEDLPKIKHTFQKGDKAKLRDDVLQRHARSVPAHLGYTKEQFAWRDTLRALKGEIGTISMVFENSKYVNMTFASRCIGIDYTELEKVQ